MKKVTKSMLVLSLLALLVFSGALTGCTAEGDDENTVIFWHGMGGIDKEALETVVKKFEEKNPDIDVKPVYIAQQGEGQNEKLLAAVAGGNPPDVAYFDRFEIGSWAAQGSLTDLTEKVKKDKFDIDMYYPFAAEEATYQNKLYGLPINTDARLLFYNNDHFKKAGIKEPPKTIAELEKAAGQLTVQKGNRYEQIGFIPWHGQGWLYTWGWSFGGDFYNKKTGQVTADDPKVVEALQWMTDYAKKYDIEDITAFTDSVGSSETDPFITGQISMMVDTPSRVAAIQKFKPDLNYGVAPIPTPTGKDFTTWSGGWSLIMPKGAEHPDKAWKFMKFAAGPEGQEIVNKKTRNLAAIDSVNQKIFADDPVMKEFIDLLPSSHYRPVISEGSLLWNQLDKARDMAVRGKGEPEELLKAVSKKVNKELKK